MQPTNQVENEYDGEVDRIVDAVRGTGMFDGLFQFDACITRLLDARQGDPEEAELVVIRAKDRITTPMKSGYRDVLVSRWGEQCTLASSFL